MRSPDDGEDDDDAGQADRRDSPGTVAQELPPRFGEDAPEEEPHQDRDQEMGQDENTDVAVLAPHGLIFAQRSGRVNYGESLFLCAGHFSILEAAVDADAPCSTSCSTRFSAARTSVSSSAWA